ncbi:coiled-coil domain-containing protein 122 [Notothenia coriiceps]|uniref:Coiled-coil domain-containing protein 122 n=1 Tax=Notothenia coriiceps TaxID=8208 RepID=A0A6I9PRY5_9TELE|nr:PREDICTED: coiled-coil domain-containing protein 122 [Notothenia coriiceps]
MSTFGAIEDGLQEKPSFSLTKAVQDVSQHGYAQTETLKDKQKTLISLQAALSGVEEEGEMLERDLRSKTREFLILEGEMEHLERQTKVLHQRYASISKEITDIHIGTSEEEENACMALARFNTYRSKMEGHRAAVLHASSQTEAHRELEEKRALVQMLREKKEALKADLDNPNGNTVQMAKSENETLKREISVMRESIAAKKEQVRQEFLTHTQIKKDIEIQNKRYEAIVKRLHCQLSRAQAVHRQMSEEVYHMERQLAELKGQRGSSQDSAHRQK